MASPSPTQLPDQLIQRLRNQSPGCAGSIEREEWLMRHAAHWAANAQLEVCSAWLAAQDQSLGSWIEVKDFEAACKPRFPSLKEQALKAAHLELNPNGRNGALIIRALEALPEDAG